MAVDLDVGEKFGSFSELQTRITDYCNANFVQLWLREARTIAAAAKRVPKRAAITKPELKYYNMKCCCIHGGQAFRSKGTGVKQTM